MKKKCRLGIDWGLQVLAFFVRGLLSLRYRIKVKGLENLSSADFLSSGGILFLPNHSAEIDPVILETILWKQFRPRPLVVDRFYYLKGFQWLLELVGALPLPSMDITGNKWRQKKIEAQFAHIVEACKEKGNFLIYPSGKLKSTGLEVIGGASFVHRLLQTCPEIHVVLVRVSGLWGSQFSRALTGYSPDFGKTVWNGAKILCKNGVFFTPRREILIEFEIPSKEFPRDAQRLVFNQFLEKWYNRYPEPGPEPLSFVSYAFWKEEFPEVTRTTTPSGKKGGEKPVPKGVEDEVLSYLETLSGQSRQLIDRGMYLSQDLGLDSLDMVQVYLFLDKRYGISDLAPGDLMSVEDVCQAALGHREERERVIDQREIKRKWPNEVKRSSPKIPEGKTLQEVFLNGVDERGSEVACADSFSTFSYRQLKMRALLLASQFKSFPGTHIGVMLPSSIGAYLVIFAILLSKKIPVMLNWTAGERALDHALETTKMDVVITSLRFLDRLENGDLGKIESLFFFLEELKEKISWRDKLGAFFFQYLNAKKLLFKLGLNSILETDPAVILFTSGTESLPKGVPLSHENLLSNQRASLEIAGLKSEDIFYGILPPFHSFGFSVTGVFPLLAGLRVYYAPDPTDSRSLERDIAQWKPTVFCSAPSFIAGLFHIAQPESLQSLRLIVSGAEKTPQVLFEYVQEHLPKAELLEGYGITECAPVVAIDRPGEGHRGVGKPLPNLELLILDSGTLVPVARGNEGEVCIAGPSVFSGYFGVNKNCFFTLNGKRWYLSGDRGKIEPSGHLILVGRLKRFTKIGGEMVSLGGLEEDLIRIAVEKKWVTTLPKEGPILAVSAFDKETDKPALILFTTFLVSKEDVNYALRDQGLGRIVKISEVRPLEKIPLTGTGKTNYRLLDEMSVSQSLPIST